MNKTSICSNCVNKEKCTFSLNAQTSVNFCEEYELIRGPEKNYKYESEAIQSQKSTYMELKDYGSFSGLCMNCEDKSICPDNKTHFGLQFCENYY